MLLALSGCGCTEFQMQHFILTSYNCLAHPALWLLNVTQSTYQRQVPHAWYFSTQWYQMVCIYQREEYAESVYQQTCNLYCRWLYLVPEIHVSPTDVFCNSLTLSFPAINTPNIDELARWWVSSGRSACSTEWVHLKWSIFHVTWHTRWNNVVFLQWNVLFPQTEEVYQLVVFLLCVGNRRHNSSLFGRDVLVYFWPMYH